MKQYMERAEVGEQGRRRVPAGPGRVAPGECVREGLQEVAAREAVEGARRHRLEIEITRWTMGSDASGSAPS